VLDIGCGGGHGSNILSERFEKVYGMDVSLDAIDYAKRNWQKPNINFCVGSGTSISFSDQSFDVVVAFEVFEHIENWRDFLKEIKRVAKKDAAVYISTPNKDLYSPGTKKPINPFHFFEMTIQEFSAAMNEFFCLETLYGQRTPVYNDHWIWKIANPLFKLLKIVGGYKLINTLKLTIINWIKPQLAMEDVVFSKEIDFVKKSRFLVAVCKNGTC